ncbi:MAG: acyl carrier protein, partial [Candidatus Binatia bacterium]
MNHESLLQRIRKAVCRELELPAERLVDSASLRREYGLDSVAAVNIT